MEYPTQRFGPLQGPCECEEQSHLRSSMPQACQSCSGLGLRVCARIPVLIAYEYASPHSNRKKPPSLACSVKSSSRPELVQRCGH